MENYSITIPNLLKKILSKLDNEEPLEEVYKDVKNALGIIYAESPYVIDKNSGGEVYNIKKHFSYSDAKDFGGNSFFVNNIKVIIDDLVQKMAPQKIRECEDKKVRKAWGLYFFHKILENNNMGDPRFFFTPLKLDGDFIGVNTIILDNNDILLIEINKYRYDDTFFVKNPYFPIELKIKSTSYDELYKKLNKWAEATLKTMPDYKPMEDFFPRKEYKSLENYIYSYTNFCKAIIRYTDEKIHG